MGATLTLLLAVAAAAPPTPAPLHLEERIDVARLVLQARVLDRLGKPVPGLSPEAFLAYVDGVPARVEAVEWIDATKPYAEGLPPAEAATAGVPAAPPGRLVVFFFQTDFHRLRLPGLMQMKARAVELLRSFTAADRIAVVSYDMRLKLRQDFTSDRATLEAALSRALLYAPDDPFVADGEFALATHLDEATAQRATSPEKALLVVARALRELPGSKSLIYAGWGLGHKAGNRVLMGSDYDEARRILTLARVSVFTLDVTDADFHDLEIGLRQVAADTGGFYAKTHLFPGQAIDRLNGALAGHYQVVVVRPELPRGEHSVVLVLTERPAQVLSQTTYTD